MKGKRTSALARLKKKPEGAGRKGGHKTEGGSKKNRKLNERGVPFNKREAKPTEKRKQKTMCGSCEGNLKACKATV